MMNTEQSGDARGSTLKPWVTATQIDIQAISSNSAYTIQPGAMCSAFPPDKLLALRLLLDNEDICVKVIPIYCLLYLPL